jgi:hypothetical protein
MLTSCSVAELGSQGVKLRAIKMYGEVEAWLYTFLILVLDREEWSA